MKECFGTMAVVLNLGDSSIKIEKFKGSDFSVWKTRIRDCLYQTKDLHLALVGYERKPAGMSDEEWHLLDRKALGIVRLCLDSSIVSNFTKQTTTKGLMDVLALAYEIVPNRVFLLRKLRKTKPESRPMQDHLNEFNTRIHQLSSLGLEFDDESKAVSFLVTLPSSWDQLVMAITTAYGTRKLIYNDVVNIVLNEDSRRMSSEECSSMGRSTASSSSRGGKGRGRSTSRDRCQSKAYQRECWNCGKTGHLKKDCWAPKK